MCGRTQRRGQGDGTQHVKEKKHLKARSFVPPAMPCFSNGPLNLTGRTGRLKCYALWQKCDVNPNAAREPDLLLPGTSLTSPEAPEVGGKPPLAISRLQMRP